MEAADSTTNSSEVIVQCHDPSSLFDQVVPNLEPRLPLSKLHWKSPNRPLRSINQLNVSFIRDDTNSDVAANARRHQIPGLRQTPFVKLFLVRCDDRETYKETCRKEVKQWLKSQGISQDGKTLMKGHERHDAYEYIILHVVLPGTAAATQPKSSKHISLEASDSTDSLNSRSKWTGKSSSTIYDKLRADFSSSSKAPFERVAQVRLTDPENKQSGRLGPSEVEEQWQDFIEKLRTAILLSFDARVSQYEEDIRDREAQRQLPGWNFCTFFVLKEGLARGFESVGLIEDALIVYDELDAGLDTIVQVQASRGEADPPGALLPFSTDLKPAIRSALDSSSEAQGVDGPILSSLNLQALIDLDKKSFPFDVERRNYQQRILTNQVSALDFHLYIFARQLQLLFRHAKISLSANQSKKSALAAFKAQHDLGVIAEICEKAASFITFAARALRRDLYTAWGGQEGLSDEDLQTQEIVIGEIVASWKWSAIMHILADCRVSLLLADILVDPLSMQNQTNGSEAGRVAAVIGPVRRPSEDLALWVGELLSMARDILRTTVLTHYEQSSDECLAKGLQSLSLSLLSKSGDAAFDIHKLLTIHAYQCFMAADSTNASHSMLHALAKIEADDHHVDEAVWWLEHIPDLSNLHAQTATDRALLSSYAQCLKIQGRLEEYARVLTGLLISTVANPFARRMPRYDDQSQWVFDELVTVSNNITKMELPLDGFVKIQSLPRTISYSSGSNGFELCLSLSLLYNASLRIPNIELTLTTINGQDPSQIVLRSKNVISLNGSNTEIRLTSNIITEGWYDLTRLSLSVGKIVFLHYFRPTTRTEEDVERPSDSTNLFPIMIYPRSDSFIMTVYPSPTTDLTQSSRLLFHTYSGGAGIEECVMRLRPASAGVRLEIQAANSLTKGEPDDFTVSRQGDTDVLVMRNLIEGGQTAFEIPYSMEIVSNSIDVTIEAVCKSSAGDFFAYYQRSITVALPISVNVQDIFQVGSLFSRFTATPSTHVPLRILKWSIGENDAFKVRQADVLQEPMDVFPKMPASWIIETIPQKSGQHKLPLVVQYQSYDDLLLVAIESQFRQDIQASSLTFATELLIRHLQMQVSTIWTEQDLEAAVLLQEFEMFSYEALDWGNTLKALGPSERRQVETWLRSWHSEHRQVSLHYSQAPKREVRLSVEMPKASVIVSTSLDLNMFNKQYLSMGEPVWADVTIESVCNTDQETEIQFEVACHPDTWLIGGKKRGTLNASVQESKFKIILVAQRTGRLLLPSIDIRCRQPRGLADERNMNVEVESRSQAKSVLVIASLQTTTVALGVDAMAGKYWPIGSRRRMEAS